MHRLMRPRVFQREDLDMFNRLIPLSLIAACATAPVAPPTPTPTPPIATAVSHPRSIECSAYPTMVAATFQRGGHGEGTLGGNLAFNYDSVTYAACTEGPTSIVCDGTWLAGGSSRGTSARLEISLVPDHGAFKGHVARADGAPIELGCLLSWNDLPRGS